MKRSILFLVFLTLLPALALANVPAGATSQCFDVKVLDTAETTPTNKGKTGLAFNTATLTCEYHRDTAASPVAITMASSTLGTYTSGAWKEVSATLQPGVYQFCPPDAAFATGASSVSFTCTGVSGMSQMDLRVTLLQPNTFGYDGITASEASATPAAGKSRYGLATGAIDVDDQFAYGAELALYDSAGLLEAVSCIIDSVNTGDTVDLAEDITSFTVAADHYVIRANSACQNVRPATPGRTLLVSASGEGNANLTQIDGLATSGNNATLHLKQIDVLNNSGSAVVFQSTGSNGAGLAVGGQGTGAGFASIGGATGPGISGVGGSTSGAGIRATVTSGSEIDADLAGTIGGMTAAALKDFFDTNSTTTYGAAVAGSVVKEIADNAAGGGGGGGGVCTSVAAGGITAASFGSDVIGHQNTAQAVSTQGMTLAAAEAYGNDALKNNASVLITSATTGAWQLRCICGNTLATDAVTLCKKFQITPTGTVKYAIVPTANCNLAEYPSGH